MKNKDTTWVITICLLSIASVFCYQWAFVLSKPMDVRPSFLINLSASLVIVLCVSLTLDYFKEKSIEQKWRTGPKVDLEKDLKKFSNMSINYILGPLGKQPDFKDNIEESEKAITELITNIDHKDLRSTIHELDYEKWKNFLLDIVFIREELRDTVLVYQSILPKKMSTELLVLRARFKTLDFDLGFFSTIFLITDEDWNKKDNVRKKLFNQFCNNISDEAINYLSSALEFRKLLLNIK